MPIIEVSNPHDPRLADYLDVRDRQLLRQFRPAAPDHPGGDAAAPCGKFMAEGEVVFEQLVGSAFPILSVLCTPARLEAIRPLLAHIDTPVPVYVVPAPILESLVGFPLHRGLMAIGARTAPRTAAALLANLHQPGASRVVVVLENLANHDNIGAVFRNSAALGAHAILLTPGCADPLYRKSIRVSVGHALRIPFATIEPWPTGLTLLAEAGYQSVALTPQHGATDLRAFTPRAAPDSARRVALLVGTEGPGLTAAAIAGSDARVRIPMAAGVDSLNVAVATAIALEHLRWLTGGASETRSGA
ncbi:MAG: TrmH family RNA methyltransferase [Phycisphaerales bacterium]